MKNHRYYCIYRPPQYAAIPEGSVDREVWMPGHIIDLGMFGIDNPREHYLGWVDYPKKLSVEQVWKFELCPEDMLERIVFLVKRRIGGGKNRSRVEEEVDTVISYLRLSAKDFKEIMSFGSYDGCLAEWLRRLLPDKSTDEIRQYLLDELL